MTQTIAQLLPEAARQLPDGWTLTATPGGVQLAFPGGRKQNVQIEERRGRYIFGSVVLGAARTAEQQGRDGTALTARLWEMNREIGLVGFMLDTHGRLVGRIDHPAETLDAAELAINLELLARECDRLEYVWSGYDMSWDLDLGVTTGHRPRPLCGLTSQLLRPERIHRHIGAGQYQQVSLAGSIFGHVADVSCVKGTPHGASAGCWRWMRPSLARAI